MTVNDLRHGLDQAADSYDAYVAMLLHEIDDLTAQVEALTPAPPRMRVGISMKDQAQFTQRTVDFGVMPEIVRIFFPGLPGAVYAPAAVSPVVSFKPPNNDVAGFIAGKYD